MTRRGANFRPYGVVEAYVGPLADGRCVGAGVVDDIYIEELDMAPVVGVFTDAYRNEAVGGEVKFMAGLNLDREKVLLEDCVAEFSYTATDGSRRRAAAKVLSHRDAVATNAVAVRTWRHDGFVYLLVVNCTRNPQSVSLSLSEPMELVSSEFGAAPSVNGATVCADLVPIGYVMVKLKKQ